MMPGTDGIEVLRQLRTTSEVPVILLTARAEELDTLVGLSVGADDYVTKPFRPRELVARIKTVLRRTAGTPTRETADRLVFPGLVIDVDAREVEAGRPGRRARARSSSICSRPSPGLPGACSRVASCSSRSGASTSSATSGWSTCTSGASARSSATAPTTRSSSAPCVGSGYKFLGTPE